MDQRSGPALWRVCFTLALLLVAAAPLTAKTPEPGETFPNLAGFAFEGETPDFAGARVVIVDFWASWCPPCKASFPVYEKLKSEYEARGLRIVGVSVDTNARAMSDFVRRMKPTFPLVRDAAGQLARAVEPPKMPTAFILDGRGVVRFVHQGFDSSASPRELRDHIETLLAEKP